MNKTLGILIFMFFINSINVIWGQTTYTWNQTGTASWALDVNWTPARTTPATNDILVFDNGATTTVTGVPTQTIGQLMVSNNTIVNLQGAANPVTLTIGGGTGTDLSVTVGSALNINVATNVTKIVVATGATGSITGNMTFTLAAHTLDAADANGITFNSPAIFTQGTGCTGNVFTNAGTANAIVFSTGTIFSQFAGANPFGLSSPNSKVVFQTGNLFKFQQNSAPSFSGRTYADFEVAFTGFSQSATGGAALTIDNLTITTGILNLNLTGGINIKGNISVAASQTLTFTPASSSAINMNGTSIQTIGSAGTLTFAANAGLVLKHATHTIISVNGSSNITIAGNISSLSGSTPLTITGAGSGRVDITNVANTFTGTITLTGTETRFTDNGSFGNANNTILVDGGRLATLSGATYTLASTHSIQVSDVAGTSISTPGSGVLTYNGNITDKPSTTGAWSKQGGGTLALGGVSTYTGSTAINNGVLQLTTGNDRLPTGTTIYLGQAASSNIGTLNLSGFNQQLAGLNSVTGTNASANNNTITSSGAATLTLGGSGTYTYGDGTNANSGVITGAISIVKSGTGNQTLGDANTYTGTTSITGGSLIVNGSLASASAVTVGANGTLTGTGTVNGTVSLSGTVSPGSSPGTINTGAFTFNTNSIYKFEISNATGVAGTDWDKLISTGAIDVTASPITIDLTSISISNFNNAAPYTWTFATGSSITGFNAANFTINTANFIPSLAGGTFSVTQTGNDLNLVFTPLLNSPPALTNPTATSITNIAAELGANITNDGGSSITARGTVYKISPGVINTDNPLDEGGTSTGIFSHTRSGLNPETQYYYAGYATNSSGTGLSPESDFRTLSNPPTSEATGFNATAISSTQIDLSWSVATFPVSGATANGYILLRRQDSTDPSTIGIVNATAPGSLSLPSGTTLVTTIASGSTNNYSNTSLLTSTQYNYIIVPFTWDGTNAMTYNYFLTNAPVANATTQSGLPVVISPTVANISSVSADLGANVTSDGGSAITSRGTVYKTSAGVTITDNPLAEGGLTTGVFSHTRNVLDPETQYFYAGYASNAAGTGLSSEGNFRTLSNSPTSEATNFTATAFSPSQIDLSWSVATFPVSGATATGYIILRKNGSNPATTGIVNAIAPASLTFPVGTSLATNIISGATNSYSNTGLTGGTQYNYLIIPYTWDGTNATTYNYYLPNGATANATTLFVKQTFASDASAFSASKWSTPSGTSCDNTNQTNTFTNGSNAYFCTPAGTGTGASITVAGITATESFTLTSASGTISNQANGVVIIDVASGKTLDLSTQNLSGSSTAGYSKNGGGILATAGNTYQGGFTLNTGTVIVRGVNALGGGAANTLTLNGGIVASNGNRDLTAKFGGGITIGGDIQFGDIGGLATNSNLTFSNNVSLGSVTRTLTKGNTGNMIFSGVISGSSGITYAANANAASGVFTISNTANTYTGTTSVTGGEVEFLGGDGAFGAIPGALTVNSIIIDGGRLTVNTGTTTTVNANRGIQIGAAAGTGISVKTGSTILVYNGVIADKPSTTGSWAKQGGNVLQLGGVSTYSGSTSVNNGALQLISGNDRLPTGTTLNLGQSASSNIGTFNMNGFSQQIAGLNSTPGSNASANNNTVTSSGAATLTFSGSGIYSFGDGTNGNSGVITGAVSIVKTGSGTQSLGDANTYTGTTTITNGELRYINPTIDATMASAVTLDGGTLGTTGIGVGRTIAFTTLNLSNDSKIDLGTANAHSITFTASNAVAWTAAKTLTVFGWEGTAGTSGTKGKIFVGTTASGLTAGQLLQIQFNNGTVSSPGTNYSALQLSSGEVVSSTTISSNIAPTIQINVASTSNYLDGGTGTPPPGPYALSGVINDPTDPASLSGIDFSISDPETAAASLMLTATSGNTLVVPNANINITGSGGTRNIKITPSTVGYATITVTVSDGFHNVNYLLNYAASAASVNSSSTRFHTGTSDASTAQGVDNDYMIVADDENQVLRLYNRQNSGLPANGFDYSVSLGISMTNPEVDIEGSVEVGNRIYWLASHSNSANSGAFRPNRYRLFATDVSGSGAGATLSYVGRYDGLRTDLIAWDAGNGHGLGANYFGLTASAASGVIPEIADGSGFNIEGLTIAPDNSTAYVCFRAPISPASNRTNALIVPVTNLTALVTGNPSAGPATFGAPIMLDLGGRGIREIMRNASGQYIIMAGPHDGGNDFKIYTWTGIAADAPEARSADLTALMTSGSIESILNVPDPLMSTSVIQVLVDNGDTDFYNDGMIAKELPNPNHKKFRSESIQIGCRTTRTPTVNAPLCTGLQSVIGTSDEPDGTVIEVFVSGSSVGTTTVSSGVWTKTGVNLNGNTPVKATALASGECVSLFSNIVTVIPSVVTNTNNTGGGSLRDLISCVGNGATITFDGSLVGSTITLTSGEILIDKDLTIMGPGLVTDVTISGNNASRIFNIAAGKTLTLQNLSLKNANAASPDGGALLVNGILNLENTLMENNFEDVIVPRGITIKSPGGMVAIIGTNVQIKP